MELNYTLSSFYNNHRGRFLMALHFVLNIDLQLLCPRSSVMRKHDKYFSDSYCESVF